MGGNICSSLTLTFGCYGSPSFLKNKVKIKLGYHYKGEVDISIRQTVLSIVIHAKIYF